MTFKTPISFDDALASHAVKTILPTNLGSAELRAIDGDFKRRTGFSAKVMNAEYLQTIRGITQDALSGELDPATARLHLAKLAELTGVDHDSARVSLITETNLATAQGYGQFIAANDPVVVEQFPAWELYRVEEKKDPRDWEQRWQFAAKASGDVAAARVFEETGRMVALKDSEIWDALGDSGNFDDALDNPYPPFYFRSGVYGIRAVDLAETRELGLLAADEEPKARAIPAFNENFKMALPELDAELKAALLKSLGGDVTLDNGVLKMKVTGGTSHEPLPTRSGSENRPIEAPPADRGGDRRLGAVVSQALRPENGGVTYSQEFAGIESAKVVNVVNGRRALFHGHWGAELSPAIAQKLQAVLPETVQVAVRDGHLYVFNPEVVTAITDADPKFYGTGSLLDRIHHVTAVNDGQNGELLGFGARNWAEPGSVVIEIRATNGEGLVFTTRPAFADIYTAAWKHDLESATGWKFTSCVLKKIPGGAQ